MPQSARLQARNKRKRDSKTAVPLASRRLSVPNVVDPRLARLPISTVIEWATSDLPDGRAAFPALSAPVMRINVGYWANLTVAQRTPEAANRFIAEQSAVVSKRTGRTFKPWTVVKAVRHLGKAIEAYAEAHGLEYSDPLSFPALPMRVDETLSFNEALRLYKAAWGGRRWSASKRRMIMEGAPLQAPTRLARPSNCRIVLIALAMGVADRCMRNLRWTGSPEGEQSYIDVDAGLLYRLGVDAPRYEEVRSPVQLPQWLMPRMRRWRRMDAALGTDWVIHLPGGKPMLSSTRNVFARIVERAGLSEITHTTVNDTCAAVALRAGASIYAVAIYLGLSPNTVSKKFKHFQADFQANALKALDRRPVRPRLPRQQEPSVDALRSRSASPADARLHPGREAPGIGA